MTKHHISEADELYRGGGYYPPLWAANERKGVPITSILQMNLGAPITLDTNGLIDAATSTELPDTETVTYTFADDGGSSPLDGANQTGILDLPRNITSVTTHGSSVVAMTITITGTDVYDEALVELLTVTAGTSSKVVVGAKAFKTVTSIAIYAGADAEANTLNMGWGDVLGLPYRVDGIYDILSFYADTTEELSSATVVGAVTSTATSTTGDVRGTITPNTATDGSVNYRLFAKVSSPNTKAGLAGVDQYGG